MNRRLQQIFWTFLGVSVLIMTVFSAPTRNIPTSCRPPTRRMMRRIMNNFIRKTRTGLYGSLGSLLFDPNNNEENKINITHNKSSKTISVDPANERCPQKLDDVKESCPHYYVLDVDNQRIPRVILQAKCKCEKCLNFDDTNQHNEFHKTYMRCKPVHYYTRVLRVTGCENNYLKYEEDWEPVAVGCSCAHGRHHPMPKGR